MSNATHSSNQYDKRYLWAEEIDAFDRLPKVLRERIANAKFTISSKAILNLYLVLKSEQMALAAIEQIENNMLEGKI